MSGRLRAIVLLAASAVALLAWVVATPIGSAPDDDFHLVSSWCASPSGGGGLCTEGAEPTSRVVPDALRSIHCYSKPEDSAACQDDLDWSLTETVDTTRGNFHAGEYPPIYYATTGLLASPDILSSALLMRVLDVLVFLGFTTSLWLLIPVHRRPVLVWSWLLTVVPLGVFLIPSNNPSSWAITGVASSALALLGWYETSGRRRVGLGVVFALAVLVAAGARADAALYVGLVIVVISVLVVEPTTRFLRVAWLPALMGLVALGFVLSSHMVTSASDGLSAPTGADDGDRIELSGFALLAYNILNLPLLWTGLLGEAGLGWLDIPMPGVVVFGTVAAFVAVGFLALRLMGPRKAIALVLLVIVLTALPLYILQAGGNSVGQNVQPRYLLPLIVVFAAVLLLGDRSRALVLTRLQSYLVAMVLAGAHLVALQLTIRRYVTGNDAAGFDLSAGAEWWWTGLPGPNVVWLVGSVAFAVVAIVAVPLLTPPPTTEADGDSGLTLVSGLTAERWLR